MNYLGSLDFKTFKEEFLDKSTLNKEEYESMRWHSIYVSELEFLLNNGINTISNDRGIITINDRNGKNQSYIKEKSGNSGQITHGYNARNKPWHLYRNGDQ